MTGPDNGELGIKIGGRRRTLRYPPGALYALQTVLGEECELSQVSSLLRRMNVGNVSTFVWAGLLHENREIDMDEVEKEVAWGDTPVLAIYEGVWAAFTGSVTGTVYDEDGEATEKGEGKGRPGLISSLAALLHLRSSQKSSGGDGLSQTSTPALSDLKS